MHAVDSATPVVLEALSQARVQAFSAGRASDTSKNANEFDPGLGTIAGLDPTSGTAQGTLTFQFDRRLTVGGGLFRSLRAGSMAIRILIWPPRTTTRLV